MTMKELAGFLSKEMQEEVKFYIGEDYCKIPTSEEWIELINLTCGCDEKDKFAIEALVDTISNAYNMPFSIKPTQDTFGSD